jgi:hypothetical protein
MDWPFRNDCPSKPSAPPRQTRRPRCQSSCARSSSTCLRPTPRPGRVRFFFIFHLLGAWREKSAYRPLARLLRRPSDDLHRIFGDTVTETTHRVMAAVFDGDPAPLYDVILDPKADASIRSRMCEAIAMVTLRGEMPRAEAARFLRACYSELEPQQECWVWHGWQSAIALLGLAELKPLVKQAFARGSSAVPGLDSSTSRRTFDTRSMILPGCRIAPAANSAYSAIPSRSYRAGLASARMNRRSRSARACVGTSGSRGMARQSISSRPSAGMIPVHAAAAGNSRNAA